MEDQSSKAEKPEQLEKSEPPRKLKGPNDEFMFGFVAEDRRRKDAAANSEEGGQR